MNASSRASLLRGTALALAAAVCLSFIVIWTSKTSESIPAAATFKLSGPQLNKLARLAKGGDCTAAERVGRHYLFFSLDYDRAVQWYRLAAKCPNVNAKTQLIALLTYYPQNLLEVDKLLLEIAAIDSQAADDARESVDLSRQEADRRRNAN
ncbi:MAG: hypothetical protein V4693_09685 [Pseudomonadota bacterium]